MRGVFPRMCLRKLVICIATVWMIVVSVAFSAQAEGTATDKLDSSSPAFKNIIALNYCTYSLAKIVSYNDRVVLDDEYNNIVNSINLKNITDLRVITIIKQLMDTLTKFRLSELEKDRLQQVYEAAAEQQLMDVLLSSASSSLTGGAVMGAVNPIGMGLGMLATSSNAYLDYQKNIKSYQNSIKDHDWSMKKEALTELNELSKVFIDTYWALLQENNAPDEWRITLDQINSLIEGAKEQDPAVRHRVLIRLEKDCGYIPVYWYYRAEAAHAAMQQKDSNKQALTADLQKSVATYEAYRGFLRKDELYASILMLEIAAITPDKEELTRKIDLILAQNIKDPTKRLFAALSCMRQELPDMALEHLQANLDARKLVVVSRDMMAEIYAQKHDQAAQVRMLDEIMHDTAVSNQEILNQLGKLNDEQRLLKLQGEISGIALTLESAIVGNDALVLSLPKRWILSGTDPKRSTLEITGQQYHPDAVGLSKEGEFVRLNFPKVLKSADALSANKPISVSMHLQTEHFPLVLTGNLIPMTKEAAETWYSGLSTSLKQGVGNTMQAAKGFISSSAGSLGLSLGKKDEKSVPEAKPGPTELVFVMEQISTPKACFRVEASGLTPCVR